MTEVGSPIAKGRTADVYAWKGDAWKDGRVLKLSHDWNPPHLIEQEVGFTRFIESAGIRVPHVYEIIEVNGLRGVVYERLDGPHMMQWLE
ncbi:hypothetical protein, partial [Escherichia coli]|uniref:hypothetical protein n=1 Tax=Escherichia coli TaxID=562 RepID=UPI000FECE475